VRRLDDFLREMVCWATDRDPGFAEAYAAAVMRRARATGCRTRLYVTLDGDVVDLTLLSDEAQRWVARAWSAYRRGIRWRTFMNRYVAGPANPLLAATGGKITRAVFEDEAFRVVYDLGDRLGVAQGVVGEAPDGGR